MKKIILFFLCLQAVFVCKAQIASVLPSSVSIANSSVAGISDWGAFANPAILGYLEKPEAGFQFENRYLVSELSTKSVAVGLPSKTFNAGVSFSYFGYSLYHEMIAGLGFARNFSDKFAMGMQFNYYTTYFSASSSYHGTLLPQVGLSVRCSPKFTVGFHSFNPFQINIRTDVMTKRLPCIFSLGTGYYFSPQLIWRTQVDKEISSDYRFATGFEYEMLDRLILKLGAYGSTYMVPCLGVGIKTGHFRFDLNSELHPLLGLNTMAGVKYYFKK